MNGGLQSIDQEAPSAMNSPHVVALYYTVEHEKSVAYQNASPLSHETPEFHLTLEDKNARFDLKVHYADEEEARRAIEPFIRCWEFETGLRRGPGQLKLRYEKAVVVDRNPSPPTSQSTSGIRKLRATVRLPTPTISARITLVSPRYPSPPSECTIDPDDPDVATMYHRYERYRLGREPLVGMAYFCLTVLEYRFQRDRRNCAAKRFRIDRGVLNKIGELTGNKGGAEARKASGIADDLIKEEERFLKQAIVEIIFRAAQVAADENQKLRAITLSDLPNVP